jgi:hypothetical protein
VSGLLLLFAEFPCIRSPTDFVELENNSVVVEYLIDVIICVKGEFWVLLKEFHYLMGLELYFKFSFHGFHLFLPFQGSVFSPSESLKEKAVPSIVIDFRILSIYFCVMAHPVRRKVLLNSSL